MNLDIRNSVVLGLIALGAFSKVMFGFAKIESGEAKQISFAEEKQQLVEIAQLWHIRPEGKNGGGMSFENIDFSKIGIGTESGMLQFEGKKGAYAIEERRPSYFLLSSRELNGGTSTIDTIRFDTLP